MYSPGREPRGTRILNFYSRIPCAYFAGWFGPRVSPGVYTPGYAYVAPLGRIGDVFSQLIPAASIVC